MIRSKKAFTLIELSVVIVIISIMLATVIVSRSLIDSAKANKIQEQSRMYSNSIITFFNEYGCLPGDCVSAQIPSIVSGGLPAACTTNVTTASMAYNVLNTGLVESTTKRTCMMYELQIAGYIKGVDTTYTTLTDSIAGKNIPYDVSNKAGSWDYGLVYAGNSAKTNYWSPLYELSGSSWTSSMSNWINSQTLILRDSNTATGINRTPFVANSGAVATDGPYYAISSSMAQKIDLKFDDGLPYFGTISGGVNLSSWIGAGAIAANTSCTNLVVAPTTVAQITGIKYLSSNDVNKGCIMYFQMPQFSGN